MCEKTKICPRGGEYYYILGKNMIPDLLCAICNMAVEQDLVIWSLQHGGCCRVVPENRVGAICNMSVGQIATWLIDICNMGRPMRQNEDGKWKKGVWCKSSFKLSCFVCNNLC